MRFIMRTSRKIALAIATVLAGSSSAYALGPAATAAATVKLTVSGASAFRDTFRLEVPSICSDTLDMYTAQAGGPDLRVYSCTLNAASGLPAGTTAAIYYRSEGGSVYGVGPVAKNIQILRLKVDTGCTANATANQYTCSVGGFNLTADTFTSGQAEKATTQVGVSDVEPNQFQGSDNWPDGTVLGGVPTQAQIDTINSVNGVNAVTFGIYVHPGVSATPIALSRQSISSIFAGLYTDWSQVPKYDGSGFVKNSSLPIEVCRREVGSGTHAATAIYFNGTGCSSASYGFAPSALPANNSGGAELTCVTSNAGAIGYASLSSTTATLINLDGVTPNRTNAALGNYGYWFENTFNIKTSVLSPTSNPGKLATSLINRLRNAATIPTTSLNTFALPVGSNSPNLPVSGTNPVGFGLRGGNSCFLPVNQN
jgi:hypothetical protein